MEMETGKILPAGLKTILQRFDGVFDLNAENIAELAPFKGAYLLVMGIRQTFDLTIPTLPGTQIDPGYYIYCGSARGSGGCRARLKRHFARDKRKHWHVDHLSLQAAFLQALAIADGDECHLAGILLQSRQFTVPVSGFGASDCKSCQSHLLHWHEGPTPQTPAI
jgi:Uri superfamily endonuclease